MEICKTLFLTKFVIFNQKLKVFRWKFFKFWSETQKTWAFGDSIILTANLDYQEYYY